MERGTRIRAMRRMGTSPGLPGRGETGLAGKGGPGLAGS